MTDTFRKVYTPLTEEQKANVDLIKTKAEELEAAFETAVPRAERTERVRLIKLAHTNLETAVMYAVKAATTQIPVREDTQENQPA